MQSPEPPSKVFDRAPNLNGTQIINYRVSADRKWSTLVGIASGSPEKYAPPDQLIQISLLQSFQQPCTADLQLILFLLTFKHGVASSV